MSWIQEAVGSYPVVVSVRQPEGTMLVSTVDGRMSAMLHPVDAIRVWDAEEPPWERFDAIFQWRLEEALRGFDERQRDRQKRVGLVAAGFVEEVEFDHWLASVSWGSKS